MQAKVASPLRVDVQSSGLSLAGEQVWRGLTIFFSRPNVIAGLWFVAALSAIAWVWGTNPTAFSSPDEAVNRLSSSLIGDSGRPFLHLPFADPENLAHPRFWVRLEDYAVPAYPPAAIYVYAALASAPWVGWLLIAALPASAVATFAGGCARLLPRERRWLAILAPALGFPALYWLLRPWMNISLMLVCLCWAFYCWTAWRETAREGWLRATCLLVGAAAAIRPDFAAYLLLAATLFLIGATPTQWRRITVWMMVAGGAAVAINLALNGIITGDPLQGAYQIHASRQDDATSGILPGPLGYLLLPWGLPAPRDAATYFARYWVTMGPIALLLAGQIFLVPLLLSVPWRQRLCFIGGLTIVAMFLVSRMSPTLYGANESTGLVRHSIPRYWTPVYLFAALPPLLFLGRCRSDVVLGVVATLAFGIAGIGLLEIYSRQPESLTYLHDLNNRNDLALERLAQDIPESAIVYTVTQDKVLYTRWNVGLIREPDLTASSMQRASLSGLPVYVAQPGIGVAQLALLASALNKRGLTLVEVDGARGLYRLDETQIGNAVSSTP